MAIINGCQCEECRKLPDGIGHWSDCAVHGEETEPKQPCNCTKCEEGTAKSLKKEYRYLCTNCGRSFSNLLKLKFCRCGGKLTTDITNIKLHIDEYKKNPDKAIEQLESCGYKCEGGVLEMNIAWIAIKELLRSIPKE